MHVVLQIFIIGSGVLTGRGVASRELGAILAQRSCDLFHIEGANGIDRRMVVAVAAGADLGGVYDASLVGMSFAVEILLADATIEKAAFGLGMSTIAAFVAIAIKGHRLLYDITAIQSELTPTLMLFALIYGAACEVGGALFRRDSQWVEAHKPTGKAILWQMTLAGLITGSMAIVMSQVMDNGRAAAQLRFSTFIPETAGTVGTMQSVSSAAASPWNLLMGGGNVSDSASGGGADSGMTSFQAMLQGGNGPSGSVMNAGFPLSQSSIWMLPGVLALTSVVKTLVTLMTACPGALDGVLRPGIALGSTLDAILGLVRILMFPTDSITVCVLIGAASLLLASQQAPLMVMCLVMELFEASITFSVPAGIAVATPSLVSKWLLSRK